MQNNIFVRGSLCYDDLYFSKEFLLGRGIIKAHKIESELAIYPRIIVDNSFLEGAKSVSSGREDEIFEWYFSEDETDGFCHFDYLKAEHNYSTRDGNDTQRILEKHRDLIISNINKYNNEKDMRIFQKYQWCKKYHNNFCKNYGYSIYKIV